MRQVERASLRHSSSIGSELRRRGCKPLFSAGPAREVGGGWGAQLRPKSRVRFSSHRSCKGRKAWGRCPFLLWEFDFVVHQFGALGVVFRHHIGGCLRMKSAGRNRDSESQRCCSEQSNRDQNRAVRQNKHLVKWSEVTRQTFHHAPMAPVKREHPPSGWCPKASRRSDKQHQHIGTAIPGKFRAISVF